MFSRKGFSEVLCAPCQGILMRSVRCNLTQSVCDFLRRVKIRKSLRKVDGVILIIDAGHAADDRIRKGAHTVT